jgi:hypothetical protein
MNEKVRVWVGETYRCGSQCLVILYSIPMGQSQLL